MYFISVIFGGIGLAFAAIYALVNLAVNPDGSVVDTLVRIVAPAVIAAGLHVGMMFAFPKKSRPTRATFISIFGIFAALAEFERALIIERTKAGLAAARARGRNGGAPFKMTPAKLRLAQAAMGKPETKVADLCTELGITRQTLYRFVGPDGNLRNDGERLLQRRTSNRAK